MKKTLKKTLSILLACTMITSVAMPTFSALAFEHPEESDYTDLDVTVGAAIKGTRDEKLHGDEDAIEHKIVDMTGKASEQKVYVECEWDEMFFTYDFGTVTEYEWDIKELKYVPSAYSYEYGDKDKPAWNKNSADVRFTNFSNRPVWCGVSFEKNEEVDVYKDVTFAPVEVEGEVENGEIHLDSAVVENQTVDNLPKGTVTMAISGAPDEKIRNFERIPDLGYLKFYLITDHSKEITVEETPTTPETPTGEHEHHYVYDQFGRLVCTGCNEVKHEYCIDEDEDGLCDECGMERDFCPDCHIGGTCKCT